MPGEVTQGTAVICRYRGHVPVGASLALLALAVGLVSRWVLRPRDGLGRAEAVPVVSVVDLVLVGGGLLVACVITGWSSG